jgi:hypothetical protein
MHLEELKKDLDLLGLVVYQYDKFDHIGITVEDNDVPLELRNGSPILSIVINELTYSHRNVYEENQLC